MDEREKIIRHAYSKLISEIEGFQEAIEKNIIEGLPIPQEILDERDYLRQVCNDEIAHYLALKNNDRN